MNNSIMNHKARKKMMKQKPHWSSPLDAQRRRLGADLALTVAARLSNPNILEKAISNSHEQDEHFRWGDSGRIGLSLMLGYLDASFPNEGFDYLAHRILSVSLQKQMTLHQEDLSLSAGQSGYGLAAQILSRGGTRYGALLHSIDDLVCAGSDELVRYVLSQNTGCAVANYDAISGLTGIARYLLIRSEQPKAEVALRKILECFVQMSKNNLSGFTTHVPQMHPLYDNPNSYSHGFINVGLSHGIPGPLAILSLSYSKGVVVEGMRSAIATIADWLSTVATFDEWGINWPSLVPLDVDGKPSKSLANARTAWCYGNPGIANSLLLASEASGNFNYKLQAIEALKSSLNRPISMRGTDSASFCHGLAGFLQIVLRFYNDTGCDEFRSAAVSLFDQLTNQFKSDSLLGFQNLQNEKLVDDPSLFEGASGIAMTILAATSDTEPTWDRLFLIS